MCITSGYYSCIYLLSVLPAHSGVVPLHTWQLRIFQTAGAVRASKVRINNENHYGNAYRVKLDTLKYLKQ